MEEAWRRGQFPEFVPVPEDLDEDLGTLRIAEVLGIRFWEVRHLPQHWVRTARVKIKAEAMDAEEQARKAKAAKRRVR